MEKGFFKDVVLFQGNADCRLLGAILWIINIIHIINFFV